MKKLFAGIVAILAAVSLQAQDAKYNDPNAEVRNVTGFSGVKVATGIELVLTQGAAEAVAVSAASAEDKANIKTEVENGVLKIYYNNGNKRKISVTRDKKLKAYVSVVTLKMLDASSGSSVKIDGTVKAGQLRVDVSSGASVKGNIAATDMVVSQGSGAVSKISGSAGSLKVDVSSGAGFYGYDLNVDKCTAVASSGGKVEITTNKELDANASSGGAVHYKGSCSVKNVRTSSGGSVRNKA
jgi:Putative auto-transporter adhesin, head GIN domain